MFQSGALSARGGGQRARQRYPHVDCIVVNDGSTDDTAVACRKLASAFEQMNSGVSEARNAGLAAARSDLVVFLDADDELCQMPSPVARRRSQRTRAAAVVGRCQVMDDAGGPLPASSTVEVDPANLYQEWLSRNFVWTPGAAMFRRRALERDRRVSVGRWSGGGLCRLPAARAHRSRPVHRRGAGALSPARDEHVPRSRVDAARDPCGAAPGEP